MTPTLTRPRFVPLRKAGGNLLLFAALGAVMLVAAVMIPAQRLPVFTDRLTIVNPTEYHIEIDARGLSDRSWFGLGGFSRESTRTTYEVLDQGRQWVLRFSSGGVEAGELMVSRADLQAGRWRLTIPESVAERLASQGVAPSAW